MHIRSFDYSDADYAALVEIKGLIWLEHRRTAAELRALDAEWDAAYLRERLVAEQDGQVVAVAQYSERPWSYVPGHYHFWVEVYPAWRGRGIGRALYDRIAQALGARGALALHTVTRETQPVGMAFLDRRGFTVALREIQSQLDLTAFDSARFAQLLARVQASGITIVPIGDLAQRDPDWMRKWYELDCALSRDVPSVDAPTPPPFEQFAQRAARPGLLRAAYFVARDGERYVGLSGLQQREASPRELNTDLTGVLPAYRRRGIATALKLHALAAARQLGYATVRTMNEDHNPMYALNRALGFAPEPAWLEYRLLHNV